MQIKAKMKTLQEEVHPNQTPVSRKYLQRRQPPFSPCCEKIEVNCRDHQGVLRVMAAHVGLVHAQHETIATIQSVGPPRCFKRAPPLLDHPEV
jgi:hypothetical protein